MTSDTSSRHRATVSPHWSHVCVLLNVLKVWSFTTMTLMLRINALYQLCRARWLETETTAGWSCTWSLTPPHPAETLQDRTGTLALQSDRLLWWVWLQVHCWVEESRMWNLGQEERDFQRDRVRKTHFDSSTKTTSACMRVKCAKSPGTINLYLDPHAHSKISCEVKTYFYKPSLPSSTSGFQCIQPKRLHSDNDCLCRSTPPCCQPGKNLWDSEKKIRQAWPHTKKTCI